MRNPDWNTGKSVVFLNSYWTIEAYNNWSIEKYERIRYQAGSLSACGEKVSHMEESGIKVTVFKIRDNIYDMKHSFFFLTIPGPCTHPQRLKAVSECRFEFHSCDLIKWQSQFSN